MKMSLFLLSTIFTVFLYGEIKISTGSDGGVYHNEIGARIERELELLGLEANRFTSNGSLDNIQKVKAREVDIGLTQRDVFMFYKNKYPASNLTLIGNFGKECVFVAVRRASKIESIDDLSGKNVATGFKGSGSAQAFDYFQELKKTLTGANRIDKDGLMQLLKVDSKEIDAYFFMAKPSRDNELIKKVLESDTLRFLPITDSSLSVLYNDKQIYKLYNITIKNKKLNFLGSDYMLPTICTDTTAVINEDSKLPFEVVSKAIVNAENVKDLGTLFEGVKDVAVEVYKKGEEKVERLIK